MADGPFHWELIDHRLVGLKLTNLAEEMHESIRAEIGQIQFNNIGNSNSQTVPSQIIAMHLRRIDEWIEETYRAYCEVWEKQWQKKTADFVRAVSTHAIPIIISARLNAVGSELSGRRARTGSSIEAHNARMEHFKQSTTRLAARWARKLEIEAKECEHAESASRRNAHREHDERETNQPVHEGAKSQMKTTGRNPTSATKLPTANAVSVLPNWPQLYKDFAELAKEERTLSPRVPGLIASVLPHSAHGADVAKWETRQSPSESLKGRFDLLATHAGAALGPVPRGSMPIDYWLHRLRQFLAEKQSKRLRDFVCTEGLPVTVSEQPVIDFVCESSALFCTQLEKQAFEKAYAQGKELEVYYHEWITSNFVSVSTPSGITNRKFLGRIARTAHTPIPIEFLSCCLDVALSARGSVAFSKPSSYFDSIADTHNLEWWITERGLWMAQQPPSGVSFMDRHGLLSYLRRPERPLDPIEITQAGVESETPNAGNESLTFECAYPANNTLKKPIQEDASATDTKTRQRSTSESRAYRTPLEGLKPEMKTVDFSDAMLAAKLTNKQYDCYSLVKEYERPMNEVEQRMGVTRKTIHEHITAAESAMRKLSLKEYRARASAKHKRPE